MTLGDILARFTGGGAGAAPAAAPAGGAQSERDRYLAYAESCMVAGADPLPLKAWQEQGRPAQHGAGARP